MAIDEKLGREIAFHFDSNLVGNVVSADLTVDGTTVEINNDSSGDWVEQILAKKNWSLSLTVHSNEHTSGSVQSTIADRYLTGDGTGTIKLGPETPVEDDVTYSGDVVINNYSVSKSTDDVLESSFEFAGNGPLTRSVEPAAV